MFIIMYASIQNSLETSSLEFKQGKWMKNIYNKLQKILKKENY